jgi:hypothetical protein
MSPSESICARVVSSALRQQVRCFGSPLRVSPKKRSSAAVLVWMKIHPHHATTVRKRSNMNAFTIGCRSATLAADVAIGAAPRNASERHVGCVNVPSKWSRRARRRTGKTRVRRDASTHRAVLADHSSCAFDARPDTVRWSPESLTWRCAAHADSAGAASRCRHQPTRHPLPPDRLLSLYGRPQRPGLQPGFTR